MAALDFPSSPALNDQYTANGVTFEWDGTVWRPVSGTLINDGSFVYYDGPLNVGIGTQTPGSKFTVNGTFNSTGVSTFDNDLIVDTDTLFVNVTNDRVGINTAAPTETFDVNGEIITERIKTRNTTGGDQDETTDFLPGIYVEDANGWTAPPETLSAALTAKVNDNRGFSIIGGTDNLWFRRWHTSSGSADWRRVWNEANDGAGSGLDADLLDGSEGSFYLDYNNFTNTPAIPDQEQVEDWVDGLLVAGTDISLAYDDALGTLTVGYTGSGGSGGFEYSHIYSKEGPNGINYPFWANFGAVTPNQVAIAGKSVPQFVPDSAQNHTFVFAATVKLWAVGAGGGGGVAFEDSGNGAVAAGGGSGGMVYKEFTVANGDTLQITSMGAATAYAVANEDAVLNGQNGEDTVVNYTLGGVPQITITAGGGTGGQAFRNSGTLTAVGGAGGTATGGDINLPGQSAGDAILNASGASATAGGTTRYFSTQPAALSDETNVVGTSTGATATFSLRVIAAPAPCPATIEGGQGRSAWNTVGGATYDSVNNRTRATSEYLTYEELLSTGGITDATDLGNLGDCDGYGFGCGGGGNAAAEFDNTTLTMFGGRGMPGAVIIQVTPL